MEYEILPAVGPGTQKRSGSVKELILAIPYLLVPGELIPPLNVLNEVLRKGIADAGMSGGCKWHPFEITPGEYEDLVRSLVAAGFKQVDAPGWVKTRNDWTIWVMQYVRGIPVDEHRRLTEEYDRLERQCKEARASGDSELAGALFAQAVQAGQRLSDFVMLHIRKDS